jgi:hypothetical protein
MSKTPGVKISLDSALAGQKVGPSHGLSSRGIDHLAHTDPRQRADYGRTPVHTDHISHSQPKERRYHGEHGDTVGGLNGVDSRDGSTMDLDARPSSAPKDSPVPTRDRQMPDKDIISKAGEVARELQRHGDGEGFRAGGVVGR